MNHYNLNGLVKRLDNLMNAYEKERGKTKLSKSKHRKTSLNNTK